MKKTLWIGLLGGMIMLVAGMITGFIFQTLVPSLKTEYENPLLFRPWSEPLMSLYFLHPFLLGLILAWIWDKLYSVSPEVSGTARGIYFALTFWVASSLPGMLISYASFQLSFLMVANWTLSGLVELICLGILFGKTLSKVESKG
jgi:hypothetical protein